MKLLLASTFILTAISKSNAANEQDAYNSAALASYKQSGLEKMVDAYVEKELKRVPQELKVFVSNTYLIGKTVHDRKMTYTWSF